MADAELVEQYRIAWQSPTPPDLDEFISRAGKDASLIARLRELDRQFRPSAAPGGPIDDQGGRTTPQYQDLPGLATVVAARDSALQSDAFDSTLDPVGTDHTPPLPAGAMARVKAHHDGPEHPRTPEGPRPASTPLEKIADDLPPGHDLKRYQVLRPFARGGLGAVSVAVDQRLHREVALKEIQEQHANRSESRHRFTLEAEITGSLEHPGIVPVYDLGQYADGRPFYTMRLIRGETLKSAIDAFHAPSQEGLEPGTRRLQLRKLLGRFIDICQTMDYAHSRGVLHRDLKPSNIMLGKYGETLVVDWGLAKALGHREATPDSQEVTLIPAALAGNSGETLPGMAVGTPAYMSPEQAAGRLQELGPASDVYSLGATLYHLLCGRPAVSDGSVALMLSRVQKGDFPRPSEVASGVDAGLEAICLKAMRLAPHERYPSARALGEDIERWLADEPLTALPEGFVQRAGRWTRRHRAWTRAGMSALALISIVSILAMWRVADAERKTADAVQKKSQAIALSALTQSFAAGLGAPDWTEAQFRSMQDVIDQTEKLDPSLAAPMRARLAEAVAHALREELNAPRLTAPEVERLGQRIAMLAPFSRAKADQLQQALQRRLQAWDQVLELAPPFASLASVFPAGRVAIEGNGLSPLADPDNQANDLVAMTLAGHGAVRWDVVFAPPGEGHTEFGLLIDHVGKTGYGVLIRREKFDATTHQPIAAPPPNVPEKAAAAPVEQSGLALVLQRNGVTVKRHELPATLASEPIRLFVSREGAQLTAQVNDLHPLRFDDAFPIQTAGLGQLGLKWPRRLAVSAMRVSRLLAPAAPSPLEQGDALFAAGRFSEALASYEALEGRSLEPHVIQEIRYKAAQCLLALQRGDEALQRLESLMNEGDEQWPARAACDLWLARLKEGQFDEADAAFNRVAAQYKFEELAVLLPDELRQKILTAYLQEFESLGTVYRYNPARVRNMERVAAVQKLLNPAGGQADIDRKIQFQIMRAYMFAGNSAAALPLARDLFDRYHDHTSLRNLVRLMCQTGAAEAALADLKTYLAHNPSDDAARSIALLRARVHCWLENWEAAEADLALARESPGLAEVVDAYLLLGYLHERTGRPENARKCWTDGFVGTREAMKDAIKKPLGTNTAIPRALVMGAWCGQIAPADAVAMLKSMLGEAADPALLTALNSVVDEATLGRLLRDMWLTPRGRRVAEEAYILERLTLAERARVPAVLFGYETMRQLAFDGQVSDQQDEALWQAIELICEALLDRGELSVPQLIPLLYAWKGNLGSLGWAGGSATLKPELRSRLAYLLARRLVLKGKADAAHTLLQQAQHETTDAAFKALVETDQQLLARDLGQLTLTTDAPIPVRVTIRSAGQEPRQVVVTRREAIELPPGRYALATELPDADVALEATELTIALARQAQVRARWHWRLGTIGEGIPGLIPRPAPLPAIHRWQLESRLPRFHVTRAVRGPSRHVTKGCLDGSVRVYDIENQRLLQLFQGLRSGITCLDWNPDHTWLAAASTNWDLAMWKADAVTAPIFMDVRDLLIELQWNPAGTHLAALQSNGGVMVWAAGQRQGTALPEPAAKIRDIAWHPDGRLLGGGEDGTVWIWNIDQPSGPQAFAKFTAIERLRWSPDGSTLALLLTNGELTLCDPQGAERVTWPTGQAGKRSLAWRPDGAALATSADSAVTIWDRSGTARAVKPTHEDSAIVSLAWTQNGEQVMTVQAYDQLGLRFWNNDLTFHSQQPFHHSSITAVTVHPQSSSATTAAVQGAVRTWNSDGSLRRRFPHSMGSVFSLCWRPDGARLAASTIYPGTNSLSFLSPNGQSLEARDIGAVRCLAWAPDGQRLALGKNDGKIQLLHADERTPTELIGHSGTVASVAWSPDGERLISCSWDGTVSSWKRDGSLVGSLKVPNGAHCVAVHPDGTLVVTSGGVVRFLNPELGIIREVGTGMWNGVAAWSPKADRLAVGGLNTGKLELFDKSGQSLVQMTEQIHISDVSWSHDATRLYSGDGTGLLVCRDATTSTLEPLWTAWHLPEGRELTFSGAGQLLHGSQEVADAELVYILDDASGAREILTPPEFRERMRAKALAAPLTTTPGSDAAAAPAAQRDAETSAGSAP